MANMSDKDRLDSFRDFTKKELIEIIQGLLDIQHGRIYTNKQVKRKLGFK